MALDAADSSTSGQASDLGSLRAQAPPLQLMNMGAVAQVSGRVAYPQPVAYRASARAFSAGDVPAGDGSISVRASEGTGRSDRLELSDEARVEIDRLKKGDEEVRAHEIAHLAAAGPYAAGGARFTFKIGPDGNSYAVGGEVPVDLTEIPGDPDATARKMAQIRAAALAPRDPSPQDRQVAAEAARIEAKARADQVESKKH